MSGGSSSSALDAAVRSFVSDLTSRDYTSACTRRQGAVRGVWARQRASRDHYGIVAPVRRLVGQPVWRLPDDWESVPVGGVAVVSLDATVASAPAEVRPGSLAADDERVRDLAPRGSTVEYDAVRCVRAPDGWLVDGERGRGREWSWRTNCPHGLANELVLDAGAVRAGHVVFEPLLVSVVGGRRMHLVAVRNEGERGVIVALHSPRALAPQGLIFTSEPLNGLPLPAGWELVVPLTVETGVRYRTVAVSGDPPSSVGPGAWLAVAAALPLLPVAGHPASERPCDSEVTRHRIDVDEARVLSGWQREPWLTLRYLLPADAVHVETHAMRLRNRLEAAIADPAALVEVDATDDQLTLSVQCEDPVSLLADVVDDAASVPWRPARAEVHERVNSYIVEL